MAYPHANSIIGGESSLSSKMSDAQIAHNTLSEARALSVQVVDMVGRLVGYEPEGEIGGVGVAEPDGMLPQLASNAKSTSYHIAKALAALNRLESKL